MQQWFIPLIRRANKHQIGIVLEETVKRHNELYPEWEVMAISVKRSEDRESQLEDIIWMLRSLLEAKG